MPKGKQKIAFVYDFDGTLIKGYMQDYGLLQYLGYDQPKYFWKQVKTITDRYNIDNSALGYMFAILHIAKRKKKAITREILSDIARNIIFYEGVEDWFAKDYFNDLFHVEHFIISSGLKEILNGLSLGDYFKKIYGCEYLYDKQGHAYWPKRVIDYTGKTQYLFRISKGSDRHSLINQKILEKPFPFHNMIFFGDGETDVPCMDLVKGKGGFSIAVIPPNPNKLHRDIAETLLKEKRVDCYVEANFTEAGALYDRVREHLLLKLHREEFANCVS